MNFCSSKIEDFKKPCHIFGRNKKYNNLNNEFYKKQGLKKYKNGKYNINFKFSGFDKTHYIVNHRGKKSTYKKISKKMT